MKNIFDLYNEQNPPEQKAVIAENVVPRDASEEAEKEVPREAPKEEQAQTQTQTQAQEQPAEDKPAEAEKGGLDNGSIQHNTAEPLPA